MISLHLEPRIAKTWDQFRREKPPYSIALDGYVPDKPLFDPEGPYANFNHHEYVDRLSTRSTTAQVFMNIKQGLFCAFSKDTIPTAEVYVNDSDYDVCVAWWLLKNHERIKDVKNEPLISKLVSVTDFMDTTGGLYPLEPNTQLMRERAWIFEPYTEARLSGRVPKMDVGEMRNIIDAVIRRIDEYTLGRGKEMKVDTRYEKIGGGDGWTMVREIGAEARGRMVADGMNAFVSVRDTEDVSGKKQYMYTLARRSLFIPFPLIELLAHINSIEGYAPKDPYAWGGSDIIAGSSRKNNTDISPKQLERIINEFLAVPKLKKE
ncbi:hypothetical protein HY495_01335 [Candidatus Woesearchaeota archaeon]|nr:hypothetical protein [Candidatus Woesearchaeota archaeon]